MKCCMRGWVSVNSRQDGSVVWCCMRVASCSESPCDVIGGCVACLSHYDRFTGRSTAPHSPQHLLSAESRSIICQLNTGIGPRSLPGTIHSPISQFSIFLLWICCYLSKGPVNVFQTQHIPFYIHIKSRNRTSPLYKNCNFFIINVIFSFDFTENKFWVFLWILFHYTSKVVLY